MDDLTEFKKEYDTQEYCVICVDYPPNKATILVDEFPSCSDCFDCVAPGLDTLTLQKLKRIN